MQIYKKIKLNLEIQNLVSFVGGGGKSTSMNRLANELKDLGKKVLITTTTMLCESEHRENDKFILGQLPKKYKAEEGTITLLAKSVSGGKIQGIRSEEVEEIYNRNIFDVILLEADGAKRKPIKAPGDHEPVVPKITTTTIGLIGLDCIGKTLDDKNTHRPELLKKIFNVDLPHRIEVQDIVKLIVNENGLFKDCYGKRIVFLNKADNNKLMEMGQEIKDILYGKKIKDVYITKMIKGQIN